MPTGPDGCAALRGMDNEFTPGSRFTYRQWLDRGGTRAGLRRQLEQGRLARVAYGVYAPAQPDGVAAPHTRIRQAVHEGRVALPLLEAAAFHELWTPPDIPTPLLSADGRRQIAPQYLLEHGGLLIPTKAWTAIALARWQPLHGALIGIDSALRAGVTKAELVNVSKSMRRWPGVGALKAAIEAGDALSESPLESWSRGLMLAAGLPRPALQHLVEADGLRMRADFAFLEQRVIGEADGHTKYGDDPRQALREEKRRQARLQAAGWIVVRWGWAEVRRDPSRWLHGLTSTLRR